MIEVVERNYGGRDTRGWFRMVHSALDARGCPTEVDVAGFRRLDASGQPTGRAGFEHLGSQAVRRSVAERRTAWAAGPAFSEKRVAAVRGWRSRFSRRRPAFLQHQPCNFDPHLPHCFRRRLPVHTEDAAELPRRAARRRRAAPPEGPRAGAPQNNTLLSSHFPYSVSYSGLSEPAPRVAGERKTDSDTETTSPVGSAEARPPRQAERRLRRPRSRLRRSAKCPEFRPSL